MFLGDNWGKQKRWAWIEIGRDATAIFSDLNFRFLLMHLHNGKQPRKKPNHKHTFIDRNLSSFLVGFSDDELKPLFFNRNLCFFSGF